MFNFPTMKLYRKFLILAVLIGGTMVVSSGGSVGAMSCCDVCLAAYEDCIEICNGPMTPPPRYLSCALACESDYNACGTACNPPPPGCPLV